MGYGDGLEWDDWEEDGSSLEQMLHQKRDPTAQVEHDAQRSHAFGCTICAPHNSRDVFDICLLYNLRDVVGEAASTGSGGDIQKSCELETQGIVSGISCAQVASLR